MSFQQVQQPISQGPQAPSIAPQVASRPFAAQSSDFPLTQRELDEQAFYQNQSKATPLQLKAQYGTITPVEQQQLGLLQAKMDNFWAQRLEQSKVLPDLVDVLGRNPQPTQSAKPMVPVQAKVTVGHPNSAEEHQADQVADLVMNMPAPVNPGIQRRFEPDQTGLQPKSWARVEPPISLSQNSLRAASVQTEVIQAKCDSCDEETQQVQRSPTNSAPQVQASLESKLNASNGGGSPLPKDVRSFMEPRFGVSFENVRVHTDSTAVQMSRDLNAQAFTHKQNIYYGAGKAPSKDTLTAHELTHVVQQGSASKLQSQAMPKSTGQPFYSQGTHYPLSAGLIQRQSTPGNGMSPPGDCSWAKYTLLKGSVETAKVVVENLGGCSDTDDCMTLATKIAAFASEIAARQAINATCFRGGDQGHRTQVEEKTNALRNCYKKFSRSNCSQDLLEAANAVVEKLQAAVVVASVVVTIAAVAALIAAIIVLAKVIAALAAAAAGGAVLSAAIATIIALLSTIQEGLAAEEA